MVELGMAARLLLAAGAVLALPAFGAGDPVRGREVALACAPCHGPAGVGTSPEFPILAGQNAAYLANATRAYRNGQRTEATMRDSVRALTERDIDDVAAWFASQKGLLAAGESRGGPAAATPDAGRPASTPAAPAAPAAAAAPRVAAEAAGDTLAGCPVNNSSIPETQDLDRDGLPDRFDAAPADASEFVRDADRDGWFEICDIRQLQAIQTLGEGAGNATGLPWSARVARHYRLVTDLDGRALGNFQPIGNCGPQGNCKSAGDKFGFTGSFDGGGHVIRRLRIARPETGGVGLFGVLARPGVVRHVDLEEAEISGQHGVGALVGVNFGLVAECRGNVRVSGANATGGMVGGHAGRLIGCQVTGEVSGKDATGGLAGDMRGFIARSHAGTRVSGANGVGGLVGMNTASTLVSSYATGNVRGNSNVGGLVGTSSDAVIADSFATGEVEGEGTNAGGLVGFNSKSMIRNSYAQGRVRGIANVGGLAGASNGTLRASYVTGKVAGRTNVGGLIGDNTGGVVRASYWDRNRTGRVFGAGNDDGSPAGGGNDNNRVDEGERNTLEAYSKTTAALRVMTAAETGWHPPASLPPEDAQLYHCDAKADGVVSADEQRPENLSWNFGDQATLPGINCVEGGLAVQSLR
ncbi:MAG: hypothetical protein AMXMBFR8_25300 [Nevskiales bacterium]